MIETSERLPHGCNVTEVPVPNAVAPSNILFISVTLDTSHVYTISLNAFASRNILVIFFMVYEPLGNQPEMSWLNEDAPENIPLASCKLIDTSHLSNGWLNADVS